MWESMYFTDCVYAATGRWEKLFLGSKLKSGTVCSLAWPDNFQNTIGHGFFLGGGLALLGVVCAQCVGAARSSLYANHQSRAIHISITFVFRPTANHVQFVGMHPSSPEQVCHVIWPP
uniref:Uncharacterized protein n=1 Tax=Eutreptiella gymnastica TaxID=73025 RepID=A0A6U8DQG1_9EUGL|mmetsp:Transcript_31905/g.57201  ORF Transcript_31905/g.57201 Transcript_31905/m.57201 type:complete len:118 (+) Transcript_31905:35-388(+)